VNRRRGAGLLAGQTALPFDDPEDLAGAAEPVGHVAAEPVSTEGSAAVSVPGARPARPVGVGGWDPSPSGPADVPADGSAGVAASRPAQGRGPGGRRVSVGVDGVSEELAAQIVAAARARVVVLAAEPFDRETVLAVRDLVGPVRPLPRTNGES